MPSRVAVALLLHEYAVAPQGRGAGLSTPGASTRHAHGQSARAAVVGSANGQHRVVPHQWGRTAMRFEFKRSSDEPIGLKFASDPGPNAHSRRNMMW